ncbi:MAG TPA: hypothetical protein VFL57_16240 [Bryobacteraceae bacterium]|nr:hypothetical protein [Bryobacteraceae bacterium]
MNRRDYQNLALERIEGARVLLAAGRYGASHYLLLTIHRYALACQPSLC